MTRVIAKPHLETSAPAFTAWEARVRNWRQPADGVLRHWDYSCPVDFECSAEVDLEGVRDDCGLTTSAVVSLVAVWWSSSTNLRQAATPVEIRSTGLHQLQFSLAPGTAGGQLIIKRSLVLTEPGDGADELVAATRGAVLWEERGGDRTRVIFEGDVPRFPTTVTDFSSGRIGEEHSVWWLDIDTSDLDASPLGCIRLYLNSSHPEVVRRNSGTTDERTRMFGETLQWDVTRTLVRAALDAADFDDGWGAFRPGSLGEMLEQLLRRLWPGRDARALKKERAADPGVFEARMQGRIGFLRSTR